MIILEAVMYITSSDFIVNYRNSISMDVSILDRQEIETPSWGIISNGGEIVIIDIDGNIKQWIEKGYFRSKKKVRVNMRNTKTNYVTQIAELYTGKCDYDNDNKKVIISLKDELEELQNIDIPSEWFLYDLVNKTTMTAKEIYERLYDITYNKDGYYGRHQINIKPFDELDEDTKNHLNALAITYPYIKGGTLWSHWNKFAVATQTQIFVGRDGFATCKYNGGT